MDAIIVDPSAGEKGTSTSKEAAWAGTAEGPSRGIFSIVRRNVVGTAAVRESYSLAPCHRFFVSSGCGLLIEEGCVLTLRIALRGRFNDVSSMVTHSRVINR